MAMYVSGKVKGVKVLDRVNRQTGEVRKVYMVGFASPKENGYDDEEIVTEVQISDSLMKQGLQAYYEKIKGQNVLAPIFMTTNAGTKRVFVNYFFSGDGRAVSAPVQKAAQ